MTPKKPDGIRPVKPPVQDHYFILGVPRNSPLVEIKRAFIKLVKIHHPDNKGPRAVYDDTMMKLATAWKCLQDRDLRLVYDRVHPFWRAMRLDYERSIGPWNDYDQELSRSPPEELEKPEEATLYRHESLLAGRCEGESAQRKRKRDDADLQASELLMKRARDEAEQ